jgi:RNA polymerase sigma-70 factor, ECF subfamily
VIAANRTAARRAPVEDEAWIVDLTDAGPQGDAALRRLHAVLLRATRHQVWRLRHLLPGAGAGELEDLAQQAADDAAMAVLRQLPTFQGRSRFTTWAYKFGILHAGARVRREAWRHREVSLPDTVVLRDRSPSPSEVTEAGQLVVAVRQAIASALTPHQRRVALALLVDDVPIDVLADRLGTTRNALYKTLHDARSRLRAALIASGHLDTDDPDTDDPGADDA